MVSIISGSFSSDSSSKLDVLRHNSDSLCVDSAKVGIFEETNKVGLSCFLKSKDGLALESEITLVLLSDFSDESLEGKFSD
jgi:hypothetical protein